MPKVGGGGDGGCGWEGDKGGRGKCKGRERIRTSRKKQH